MAKITRLDGRHLLYGRTLPFVDAFRVAEKEGRTLPTLEGISNLLHMRRDIDDAISRTAAFYITRTVVCALDEGETFVQGVSVQDGRDSYRLPFGGIPILDGRSIPLEVIGHGGGLYFDAAVGDFHTGGRKLVFSPNPVQVKPIGPLPDRDGWTTSLPGGNGYYFLAGNGKRRVGPIVVGVGALERHIVFVANLPDIMSYGIVLVDGE
jgi:hypothetical protein